jgi:2-amino-4-hydroxy-6-hydroxymethyldihydropteridine diphosphokinase
MQAYRYVIALGSNRRHGRYGAPRDVIRAAVAAMAQAGLIVCALSPIIATPALGPAGRSFANAAVIVETPLDPPAVLILLKRIEQAFRRRRSRRWGARVIDLDIALWSGGRWPRRGVAAPGALAVPHRALHQRDFVLRPLTALVPDWRLGAPRGTIRQSLFRLSSPKPVDRARRAQ